jgi:hypothetical protein
MSIRAFTLSVLLISIFHATAPAQTKKSQGDQSLRKLQAVVAEQSERIKKLEERLAELQTGRNERPHGESIREVKQRWIDENKASLTNELNGLALRAYRYYIQPTTMGGGGGSYVGFSIPNLLVSGEGGTYQIENPTAHKMGLRGISALNTSWTVTLEIDGEGTTTISYSGFDTF